MLTHTAAEFLLCYWLGIQCVSVPAFVLQSADAHIGGENANG